MMAKKIVLDAGHGGKDSGANGNGLAEKNVVLTIATATKKYLEANYNDVVCYMTREGDTYPSLSERTKKANGLNADLFISFHINAATTPNALGFETYVHNGSVSLRTKTYQTKIHSAIMQNAPFFTDRGKRNANYQVLRDTKTSAILIEYGFISNAHDSSVLKDSSKLSQLALSTALGIASALGLTRKQTAQNTSYKVAKTFDDKAQADTYLSSLTKDGHKGFTVEKI